MKFLLIETSGDESFVALSRDQTWTKISLPAKKQRQYLLPAIDQLLTSYCLRLEDLDFVAAGKGPGAFTGTRVGVLTAKTISFAKNLPLLSFCSLSCFLPKRLISFLLLVDAKSRGFYVYDGKTTDLLLPEALCIREDQRLFSPHPKLIEKQFSKPVFHATLNLPSLIDSLEKQFLEGKALSPHALQVSYL